MERIIKEDGNRTIVCDNAEPRSIADLIRRGLKAYKARKGQGSRAEGIRRVQQKKIYVHEDSIDVMNELNNYKWKVDNRTDTVLDDVVKENDDALDAVRYIVNTFEI